MQNNRSKSITPEIHVITITFLFYKSMIDLFKYLFLSENKKLYRGIARQFKTTRRNVYKLAHGKKARNYNDYEILRELTTHEIIEGVMRG